MRELSGKEQTVRLKGLRCVVTPLVLIAVVAVINGVAVIASAYTLVFHGDAAVYLPQAVMPVLAIWFGPWALIGGWLSTFLIDQTTNPYGIQGLYFDMLGAISSMSFGFWPWVGFRAMKADPRLLSKRDYLAYGIFAVLLPIMIVVTYWPFLEVYVFKYVAVGNLWLMEEYGLIDYVIITPLSLILLKLLSKYVVKTRLYVKGWIY